MKLFLLGVVVGWITKVPFLIKWYRELKQTRTYEYAMHQEHLKKLKKTLEKYESNLP